MKLNFFKNKYFLIFLVIFALGIFLRAYNFTPWLHFELDQARDANLISEAIEGGAGELPLLGPRAAGSFLRLGPAVYYIEYIFAKVFGDTPQGSAFAVLFFSIFSIPASYIFFRRYFSKNASLALMAVFSSSLFVTVYSRFSWNPNLLPFFVLTFLYALLRLADENKKRSGYWLVLAAFLLGILSQFHFLALVILSLVSIVFLFYAKPRIKLRFWLAAVLVGLFLYAPVIINEIKTEGANYKQFMSTISGKSNKEKHSWQEKVIRNYSENALKYWIIITGNQTAELPSFKLVKEPIQFDVKCDQYCRDNLPKGALAALFFTAGLILLTFKIFTQKDPAKKDFLILNWTLFVISFVIFTPLAFSLSPRFFLITISLPFVFLGMIIAGASSFLKNKNIFWVIAIILSLINLFFVFKYFNELRTAISEENKISHDRILKQKTRITLEQQNAITDYMEKFYQENKYPIFYHGQSEFHRAFAHLLDKRKIPRDGISKSKICRQGNYFLIVRTQSDPKSHSSYMECFDILEEEFFGTLTVFHLKPKNAVITCEEANQKEFRNYKNEGGAVAKRYNWNELFEK